MTNAERDAIKTNTTELLTLFRAHEKSDRFYFKIFAGVGLALMFEIFLGLNYLANRQTEIKQNQATISQHQSVLMKQLFEASADETTKAKIKNLKID
jgi:hypothetical protein